MCFPLSSEYDVYSDKYLKRNTPDVLGLRNNASGIDKENGRILETRTEQCEALYPFNLTNNTELIVEQTRRDRVFVHVSLSPLFRDSLVSLPGRDKRKRSQK